MNYLLEVRGRTVSVEVRALPDGRYGVAIDRGPERLLTAEAVGAAEWLLTDGGSTRKVAVHVAGDGFTAQVRGHGLAGTIEDPRAALHHADDGAGAGALRTPMPGAIARLLVKVGDAVKKGQVLVVVEAMKMENEFKSPIDGVVTEVGVTAGTTVEAGTLLVAVAAAGDA